MTTTTDDGGDLKPQEWLDSTVEKGRYDRPWTHPAPEFPAVLEQSRRRRRAEHEIVTSLAELRRATGLNQTELAQRWGHHQPHVSKIENDPTHVELATLPGYVRALGGRLTITVEAAVTSTTKTSSAPVTAWGSSGTYGPPPRCRRSRRKAPGGTSGCGLGRALRLSAQSSRR